MLLDLDYLGYSFSSVSSLATLYKENLPETSRIKSLVENIKLLFKIPQTCIKVEVAEEERVYKIGLIVPGVHKIPIGYFVYIPLERRLDAYSVDNPRIPILQWKQKRLVYSGCGSFLDRVGVESLFSNLINIL